MARPPKQTRPPALTPELAEQRCIESAYILAQSQLDDGTASPSVITHFLKMGTERSRLEREKLERETELLRTKNTVIQNAEQAEKRYAEAIAAMKIYSGQAEEVDEEDDDW
jgi:hypothetical protein